MLAGIVLDIVQRMHRTVHKHFERCAASGDDEIKGVQEESPHVVRRRSLLGCKKSIIKKTSPRRTQGLGSKDGTEVRIKATATGSSPTLNSSVEMQILRGSDSPVCSRPNSVSLTAESLAGHGSSCAVLEADLQPVQMSILLCEK
jgi:hypothetical protein